MIPRHILILGGLLLAGGVPAAADDPEAGRKVANMCRTCHGLDGYARIPIAPHIGGEPQSYLEGQLMAFKTGARTHEMMSVVAAGLSAQQIADVAAWYAAHTAEAVLPAGADAGDAPAACTSCHGAQGLSQLLDAPNLAGETNIYIETQLKAFQRGDRDHPAMQEVASKLSDADMRAVADWYASIGLEIAAPAD